MREKIPLLLLLRNECLSYASPLEHTSAPLVLRYCVRWWQMEGGRRAGDSEGGSEGAWNCCFSSFLSPVSSVQSVAARWPRSAQVRDVKRTWSWFFFLLLPCCKKKKKRPVIPLWMWWHWKTRTERIPMRHLQCWLVVCNCNNDRSEENIIHSVILIFFFRAAFLMAS